MKYIQNTGRYDRAYEIEKGNQKIMVTLYRRRLFMDTGNVAVTGITAVEDEDYALLEKNRAFERDFKDKDFGLALIDESVALGNTDKNTAELEKENKELKKEGKKLKEDLAKAKKVEEDNKALSNEVTKLKAQLEALTKGKATKPADDEIGEKADDENGEKADNEADEDEGF